MSLSHSPKIVTEGLTFYYDMNNTQKSWKGKPTTNLFPDITGQSSKYNISQYIGKQDNVGATFNYATSTHGVYTLSADIRLFPDDGAVSPRVGLIAHYTDTTTTYGTDYSASIKDGVMRRSVVTITTNTAKTLDYLYGWVLDYSTANVRHADAFNIQLEQNSFATPFADGSRSTTQALLDLTGNNTITANSLTYNSDNTFSFNGAQRLTGTFTNSATATQYTRIVWVTATASNSQMKSAFLNIIGNNSDMAIGIINNHPAFHQYTRSDGSNHTDYSLLGPSTIPLNTPCMIAITVDRVSNIINVYLNGILDITATRIIGSSSSDSFIIGGPQNDDLSGARMWYGNIYNAMHYNRALSNDEIKQNFNALRGRFGI